MSDLEKVLFEFAHDMECADRIPRGAEKGVAQYEAIAKVEKFINTRYIWRGQYNELLENHKKCPIDPKPF